MTAKIKLLVLSDSGDFHSQFCRFFVNYFVHYTTALHDLLTVVLSAINCCIPVNSRVVSDKIVDVFFVKMYLRSPKMSLASVNPSREDHSGAPPPLRPSNSRKIMSNLRRWRMSD